MDRNQEKALWRAVELIILTLVVVVCFKVAWSIGDAIMSAGETVEIPMPCDKDQVYVWDDYPTSAHCVWNQDHAGHTGHEEK